MSKLYFVRHGESEWNVADKICGRTDIPLTKRGHEQAVETGKKIVAEGIKTDEILYSPLLRAADTAKHISEMTGIPAHMEPRLIEQNFGVWEGTSPRNAPEFLKAKKDFLNRYGNGESMFELAQRIYNLLDELKEQQDKTYILVAHNGIARVVQSYFKDMTNEEYAAFYRGIIDDLLEHPACTVEEVALAHCEREMGKEPNDQLRIALHKMIFIDLYVRNYWRGKAVRTLVNAGIPVHVVGKGWEELEDVRHPECLKLHPQTDSVTCLEMLADAKVSLNVMPWFKDGAHDRVFNSILNGAVCVTDPSCYLEEELHEGEGVCYVALQDMDALPEKVKDLLQNDSGRNEIVRRGRAIVEQKHTWAERAKTLAAWIAEDAAQ